MTQSRQIDGTCSASPETPLPETSKPADRFVFVDGLRGLAALSIVVFHIWWYEPEPAPALESAHWIVDEAFLRTRGGVQILLVISGFVIAYTLRRTWFTPAEVLSFMGRRVVRLVPAYWVTIGLVILVDTFCTQLWGLPSPFAGQLSMQRVIAHMTFLQDVVGQEALGAGMWTLCIEMQFYIMAILTWGLAQRLFPRPVKTEPKPSAWGLLTVFPPAAFVSLFHWRLLESTEPWVTHFLWMFFLGMSTWWTLDRMLPRLVFSTLVMIAAVELVFDTEWRYENAVALVTALAIFAAGSRNRMHTWLGWWPLQSLGRISYSLYLIHFPVCHLVVSVGWKLCDNAPTSAQASVILLTALPMSLLAGYALYLVVEAPTAGWAARMKRVTNPIA